MTAPSICLDVACCCSFLSSSSSFCLLSLFLKVFHAFSFSFSVSLLFSPLLYSPKARGAFLKYLPLPRYFLLVLGKSDDDGDDADDEDGDRVFFSLLYTVWEAAQEGET